MKRLIIGLLLGVTFLVPVSCGGAPVEETPSVEPTYEELQAARREAGQLLDELGLSVSSGINIKENQVEVYVTDSKLFYKTLQEADAQLPDHVVAIIIYEPLYEIPFEINPDPSVHFLQLKMRSGTFAAGELYGELALEDGYLRVEGTLIIWQPDYFVDNNEGTIEILDRNGEVVARVGEEVYMGGGATWSVEHVNSLIREPLPQDCQGPFWFQGMGTRLNLNFSSDLFSLEIITSGDHEYYFLKKKPLLEELIGEKITVTGELVATRKPLYKCSYIQVAARPEENKGIGFYTPIWPADYQARVTDGVLEIIDGDGQLVVRDGEEVSLDGIWVHGIRREISRQLHEELPAECYNSKLIVKRVLRGGE